MIIQTPIYETINDSILCVSASFTDCVSEKVLYYKFDAKYKGSIEKNKQLSNSFVLALLPNAMALGEDIYVKAEISEKLLHNINEHIIPLLTTIHKNLKPIKVHPDGGCGSLTIASPDMPPRGACTGFSAGVDSFYTIYKYLNKDDSFSLKYLLVSNTYGKAQSALFERYSEILRKGSFSVSLPLIIVNTNFHEVMLGSFYNFHSIYNISVSLLFPYLFSRYYYSSTLNYYDAFKDMASGSKDIGCYDSILLHLLSIDELEVEGVGHTVRRIDKVKSLASFPPSHAFLNVCMRPDKINCGECPKCTRTLLSLEAINKIENFKSVFDIDKWASQRNKYRRLLFLQSSAFAREIISEADKNHIVFVTKFERVLLTALRHLFEIKFLSSLRKEAVKIMISRKKLRD